MKRFINKEPTRSSAFILSSLSVIFSFMDFITTFNQSFLSYFHQKHPNPSELRSAMEYTLRAPGKRIRPLFVHESAKIIDLDSRLSELLSFAVELVHLFSLVHDDLPCMDNDDLRRGIPTTHKKFNEAQALLAGDALLVMAMETFLEMQSNTEPQALMNAFQFFTRCIGNEGMIGGQSLELALPSPKREELIHIQSLKTGALFQAAILTPLLLKGISRQASLYLELSHYAQAFGFAYQIVDDLEDEKQDQAQQQKNILSLLGRKKAIEMAIDQIKSSPQACQFSATDFLLKKLQ